MSETKRGQCNWPGCSERTFIFVNGIDFCREHHESQLRKLSLEGLPNVVLDDRGRPNDRPWLNKFARLATECGGAPDGLTKYKVQERSFGFQIQGTTVSFQIERHPVGRVLMEKWAFDVDSCKWTLLEKATISSRYKLNAVGDYLECPKCKSALDVTPGRARCPECRFIELHEHSE